jgi:hypothetical protein
MLSDTLQHGQAVFMRVRWLFYAKRLIDNDTEQR